MKATDAQAHFGSKAKVAEALKISRGAVSHWFKNDLVPIGSASRLQILTNGDLQVDFSLYEDNNPKKAA